MKKMYLIFSLFLMILGINTANASVSLGDPVTNPETLTNGSKITIRSNAFANEANQTYKFFSALADSLVYAVTTVDIVDPYVTYTLETAEGKTINDQQAYYLKNDFNGRYLSYIFIDGEDGSIYDDGTGEWVAEMYLTFTDDKAKATPVIITTQEDGGKLMGYVGDAPATENNMMIITVLPEHNNDYVAFNHVYDRPLLASYNDWATWWQINTAVVVEDYIADLTSLFTKVQPLKFVGGTDPGCYDQALVDAFEAARTEADKLLNESGSDLTNETAKVTYKKLEEAYLALMVGTAVPVTEGYYRITSAYSGFTDQQGPEAIKTIYSDNTAIMKWKNLDKEDATMVWQFIDRHDGTWLLYNVGTGQYVDAAKSTAQSANYTMTNDSTNCGVTINGLGQSAFNLIPDQYAMHAGGHNSGAGVSGTIVGWNGGLNGGSAWYITKVSEEQIPGFEEIGKQNILNRNLEALYKTAKAKYDIGSSFSIEKDTNKWLVTVADFENDPGVVYSNADHNTWNPSAPDGIGYKGLLDTDSVSFWHSCWANIPDTVPYLQFKLNKAVNAFAVYITKRANVNQAQELYFSVTNDTVNGPWIKAGSITGLPGSAYQPAELTFQSNGIELDGKYQYVRVTWKSANGFTHFSGFHFQEATLSQDCQNVTMGEVATTLKTQLKNAEALIEAGKATQEAIDALQAAYDNYVAELADPTVLKAKLDSISKVCKLAATPSVLAADGVTKVFTEGNPGVYTDAAKQAFQATVDEVQAYVNANDAAGTYTKDAINTNLDKLLKALADFKATAPKLSEANANEDGLWYYITYSKHYFDVTGNTPDANDRGDIRQGNIYVNADINNDLINNAKLNVTGDSTLAELKINEDLAKWRFINLGDTAYAIQNKATGLYIGEKTGGNAGLSMTPVAYKINDIGYATFLLEGYRLNGKAINPLHVQTDGQLIVYWGNRDLGGGSCFDIVPTTEAATDVQTPTLNFEQIIKGRLYIKSYPISFSYIADAINSDAYPYQIATIDVEKKEMTLAVNEDIIEAGRPFFYIGGGAELGVSQEPTKADTTSLIGMLEIDKVIAQTPGCDNGLIGNYYGGTKVAKGFGIIKESKGVQSIGATTEGQQIGWNSGYIDAAQIKNAETPGTVVVPLTGNLETAIKDAIIDAQTGNVNVYSIDGILIKKNVKVSEATKGLAKGIYIVGNKKVAVK